MWSFCWRSQMCNLRSVVLVEAAAHGLVVGSLYLALHSESIALTAMGVVVAVCIVAGHSVATWTVVVAIDGPWRWSWGPGPGPNPNISPRPNPNLSPSLRKLQGHTSSCATPFGKECLCRSPFIGQTPVYYRAASATRMAVYARRAVRYDSYSSDFREVMLQS